MADILDDLMTLARTEDTGERWKGAVATRAHDEIVRLRAAARLAHHEMRHTVAPRNSFTNALDALDHALSETRAKG